MLACPVISLRSASTVPYGLVVLAFTHFSSTCSAAVSQEHDILETIIELLEFIEGRGLAGPDMSVIKTLVAKQLEQLGDRVRQS